MACYCMNPKGKSDCFHNGCLLSRGSTDQRYGDNVMANSRDRAYAALIKALKLPAGVHHSTSTLLTLAAERIERLEADLPKSDQK